MMRGEERCVLATLPRGSFSFENLVRDGFVPKVARRCPAFRLDVSIRRYRRQILPCDVWNGFLLPQIRRSIIGQAPLTLSDPLSRLLGIP